MPLVYSVAMKTLMACIYSWFVLILPMRKKTFTKKEKLADTQPRSRDDKTSEEMAEPFPFNVSDGKFLTKNPQLSAAGLDAHLDLKVSMKISDGRYVHFSSLLSGYKQNQKLVMS